MACSGLGCVFTDCPCITSRAAVEKGGAGENSKDNVHHIIHITGSSLLLVLRMKGGPATADCRPRPERATAEAIDKYQLQLLVRRNLFTLP